MIKIDQELVSVSAVPAAPIGNLMYFEFVYNSNEEKNKEFLLKVILGQLGLTDEDLERDPSCIKDIVRDSNIYKVLEN